MPSAWTYAVAPFALLFRGATLLLSLIVYILSLIWHILFFVLIRPIITVLYVLVLPALYFASWIGSLLDSVGYFLRQFETVYVFLGSAALLGIVTGVLVFAISTGLIKLLRLQDPPQDVARRQKVRSVEEYRADRERRRENRRLNGGDMTLDFSSSTSSSTLVESKDRGQRKWSGRGLQSPTTILEEEDSDE